MESKNLKGQKNLFELREHSSYGGSSYRGFFIRVYQEISTVPTNLFELRRHSSYRGSSYRDSTVLYIKYALSAPSSMRAHKLELLKVSDVASSVGVQQAVWADNETTIISRQFSQSGNPQHYAVWTDNEQTIGCRQPDIAVSVCLRMIFRCQTGMYHSKS